MPFILRPLSENERQSTIRGGFAVSGTKPLVSITYRNDMDDPKGFRVGQRIRVISFSVYINGLEGTVLERDNSTGTNQIKVRLEFPGGYTSDRYLEPECLEEVISLSEKMHQEDCERIWQARWKTIFPLIDREEFKTISFSCPEPAIAYMKRQLHDLGLRFDMIDDEFLVYLYKK